MRLVALISEILSDFYVGFAASLSLDCVKRHSNASTGDPFPPGPGTAYSAFL